MTPRLATVLLLAAGCLAAFGPQASSAPTEPRLGKYTIYSEGRSGSPKLPKMKLHLGYVELQEGGKYQFLASGGRPVSGGTYKFDAPTSTVKWVDGPFERNKWGGRFSVRAEGTTHWIDLTGSTYAYNIAK